MSFILCPALRDKAFRKGVEYTSDAVGRGDGGGSAIYAESFEALQRVASALEERFAKG